MLWLKSTLNATFGFKAELQITSLSSSFSFIGMEPRVQERLSYVANVSIDFVTFSEIHFNNSTTYLN